MGGNGCGGGGNVLLRAIMRGFKVIMCSFMVVTPGFMVITAGFGDNVGF